MHAAGISQRKVDKLCRLLFGKAVVPRTTQHVFEELLQQEAFQINNQPLHTAAFDCLCMDGLWQTVRGTLTGEAKSQVALAVSGYSLERDEHRFLGFALASSEDEASWKKMLVQLQERGLDFSRVKLVTADGAQGLLAALEKLCPDTSIQLCLAHRYRNVLAHTSRKHKQAMSRGLKQLTQSLSKEEFLKHAKQMEDVIYLIEYRSNGFCSHATSQLSKIAMVRSAFHESKPAKPFNGHVLLQRFLHFSVTEVLPEFHE